MEIKGIADDAIELGYATEWGESPGAKAVASIKEFTRGEEFKMFSGSVFNTNAATDKWTQIIPKDSSSLSVAIKLPTLALTPLSIGFNNADNCPIIIV